MAPPHHTASRIPSGPLERSNGSDPPPRARARERGGGALTPAISREKGGEREKAGGGEKTRENFRGRLTSHRSQCPPPCRGRYKQRERDDERESSRILERERARSQAGSRLIFHRWAAVGDLEELAAMQARLASSSWTPPRARAPRRCGGRVGASRRVS
ncbi:hypothetical protein NL676_018763 [Syzygium grande]|nr:hypothetical protein NL676_018763 [Syzygium grande]